MYGAARIFPYLLCCGRESNSRQFSWNSFWGNLIQDWATAAMVNLVEWFLSTITIFLCREQFRPTGEKSRTQARARCPSTWRISPTGSSFSGDGSRRANRNRSGSVASSSRSRSWRPSSRTSLGRTASPLTRWGLQGSSGRTMNSSSKGL